MVATDIVADAAVVAVRADVGPLFDVVEIAVGGGVCALPSVDMAEIYRWLTARYCSELCWWLGSTHTGLTRFSFVHLLVLHRSMQM